MSLGELLPERARVGLDQAAAQLPWDIYTDLGNVYLAVLLQDTGWINPRSPHLDAAHLQASLEPDVDPEPADPDKQAPINWSHL